MTILTLKELFIECQDSQNQHELLKSFFKLYKSSEQNEFIKEFLLLVRHPMAVYAREPCVEKTIDFVSKAVTYVVTKECKSGQDQAAAVEEEEESEEMHPFLLKFFTFLLDVHSAKDRAVRFRCCQLVTRLLKDMGEGAQIDDDLYDRIYRCMVERLRDKCPQVRVHAVLALTRLQDPLDETCPIVKAYMILMTKDPNMEVRRIVLTCIAPSTISLASIFERTRDVKEAVRRTAFSVIAEKVPIRALTIQQRVDLIQSGLNDRSELVQTTCSNKLLQSWLLACQGNVLELLERLDVQTSVKTCQKALGVMFKSSAVLELVQKFDILNDKHLIPEDKLTCEAAFYWKNMVEYVQALGHEYEEQLDLIQPNCVEFCSYIKSFAQQLKDCTDMEKMLDLEFVMEQLLQLLSMMDLSDTASRKATEKLLHDLLVSDNMGPSLVTHILPCLRQIHTSTEKLVTYVAETISEIREPITQVETKISSEDRMNLDKKIASIRVKVNELRQELSDCIEKQDFERAAQIKADISNLDLERSSLLEESQPTIEEVRTTRNDPLTMLKCLTVVCELLVSGSVKKWLPQLHGLMESQILPGMINEEAEVRNVAVRAIGLCCHINKDMIMQHLSLLLQATMIDTPLVRATAFKAIFDFILIFGLDSFSGSEDATGVADQSVAQQNDDGDTSATNESGSTHEAEKSLNESVDASKKSMIEEDGKKTWSETASKVIVILSAALDSEIPELRCVAAEGLSKLLLSDRLVSAKLLSHLLLLWFNPLMEDDEKLSQILGAFFPLFAFSSSEHQQLVEETFLPTLKTISRAPSTSPLSEVNDVNVANFLVELTDARHLVENVKVNATLQENPCHDSLAVKLCNEILSHPDSFTVKLWLRALNQLNISPDNNSLLRDLSKMTEEIGMVVTEKQCLKLLEKFRGFITEMLEAQTEENSGASNTGPRQSEDESEETSGGCQANGTDQEADGPKETEGRPRGGGRKSAKTPSVPSGNTEAGSRSVRKTSRPATNASVLEDSVFATPRPKTNRTKECVEETRQDLENLMLEHRGSKTPLMPGTPTPKRPLHSIQDPAFTE